jgi:predicted permease
MPNENGRRDDLGRSITERYALATLVALVTLVVLSLIAIIVLAFRFSEPDDARISAVLGITGPAIGGLLIMLQNAQVRSSIQADAERRNKQRKGTEEDA